MELVGVLCLLVVVAWSYYIRDQMDPGMDGGRGHCGCTDDDGAKRGVAVDGGLNVIAGEFPWEKGTRMKPSNTQNGRPSQKPRCPSLSMQ